MTAAQPVLPAGVSPAIDWGRWLSEHEAWLRRVILARTGEPQAVEEVWQQVALAAVEQRWPLTDPAKVAPWLHRLAGIAIGVIVLQAVNLARLVVLTMIASRWPELFDYFHEYIWQGIFVAMLALLVATWIDTVNRKTAVLR